MPNILLSKGYSCMAKMDAFWPSKSRRFYSSMSSALCSEGACYEHMSLVKSREDNQWIQLDDSLCLCNLWGNWGATCSDFSVKNHRASWYIWFFRQKFGLLFLTYISPWKKTQTQKTKHSVTGIFCSNLDRNTVGEKPSFSVFVEIFIWCARFSFVGLNRTRNFHFFPTAWARCITTLGRAFWR